MPKSAKKPALRGIIIIMAAFTALLLVGFTLLHAQLQSEVMDLVLTWGGREVIDKAAQIRTPDDEEALQALADAMRYNFDFRSMVHFSRSFDPFRPYAVIKIYDQDDQLIAMESAGTNPKRLARLEAKADAGKRNWSFGSWGVTHGTDIFKSEWYEATYTDMKDEIAAWYEANLGVDTSQWIHTEGNTSTADAGLYEWWQARKDAMEKDLHEAGYLYYTFAADGYPFGVTLKKMAPVYILTAGLLCLAIHLVRKKFTAIPTTATEEAQCPTSPNPT